LDIKGKYTERGKPALDPRKFEISHIEKPQGEGGKKTTGILGTGIKGGGTLSG